MTLLDRPVPAVSSPPQAIVTTSWDDGEERDLRLADLLRKHDVPATFYPCPVVPTGRVLEHSSIRQLSSSFEIGAHTMSHADLTRISPSHALSEMRESKARLEDICGSPITMFCFPCGRYNRTVTDLVAQAGFAAARTNDAFRLRTPLDGPLLHVTLQAYPHTRFIHVRHAAHHGNWPGLFTYLVRASRASDWTRVAQLLLRHALRHGGIWHLWGHSWEIDVLGLWGPLEEVVAEAGRSVQALKMTNHQVVCHLANGS